MNLRPYLFTRLFHFSWPPIFCHILTIHAVFAVTTNTCFTRLTSNPSPSVIFIRHSLVVFYIVSCLCRRPLTLLIILYIRPRIRVNCIVGCAGILYCRGGWYCFRMFSRLLCWVINIIVLSPPQNIFPRNCLFRTIVPMIQYKCPNVLNNLKNKGWI